MSKQNKEISVSEQILEIRFKPNPKVLDFRGVWAEILSAELSLPEWQIVENRVDIHDKLNKERVFIGYRNAGFTCFDAPTENYFVDKGIKFLKKLFALDGFDDPVFIERIGVRYKSITPHSKDFDDLLNRYVLKCLNVTPETSKAFNAKLIDIGGALNFVDSVGNFNTSSGPMAKEQMKKFINHNDDYPSIGLYFDIDYWTKANKTLNINELIGIVKAFDSSGNDKKKSISKIILEN